jgi:uncharacterized phage-associated protein
MTHDGRAIANFILDAADRDGRVISNLSLQKLVYFCHVWSLVDLGGPLVRHSFEAWEYGPVLQYLYREFRSFEARPIAGRARRLNPLTGATEVVTAPFDAETRQLLDRVLNFYGRLSAGALVALAHVEDGPWHRVWNHAGRINPGMRIDDRDIVRFYARVHRPFPASASR